MIDRPSRVREKPVLLINDVPVKAEITANESFSAISNVKLLMALRNGKLNETNIPTQHEGIKLSEINYTYLDYGYFGNIQDNVDFALEISGQEKEGFVKVSTHKSIYVSPRLYDCVTQLVDFINQAKPVIILVTGKWALMLLTGLVSLTETAGTKVTRKPLGGILQYRASVSSVHESYPIHHEYILVPIIHPVNALTMLELAPVMELDIRKIGNMFHTIKEKGVGYYKSPTKEIYIADTVEKARLYAGRILEKLKERTLLSVDVETMFQAYIDCIGIGYNDSYAFVFPIATGITPLFHSLEDETEVLLLLKQILEHENALHVGQNYQYDCQYFYHNLGIKVTPYHDTMLLHHALYNFLPKNLAFLASLYARVYTYWKDESSPLDFLKRWQYNAKDVMYTFEIINVLLGVLEQTGDKKLQDLYLFRVRELLPEAIETMNHGVLVDLTQKETLKSFYSSLAQEILTNIQDILGFEINLNSTPQKKKLLKDFLNVKLKVKRGINFRETETMDSASMLSYMEDYPEYKPLFGLMIEYSAISKFVSTFLSAKVDADGRMRTQFRVEGTNTGRLASTKNVFGGGCNMQNLPPKGKLPLHYTLQIMDGNVTDYEMEDWTSFMLDESMSTEIEVV